MSDGLPLWMRNPEGIADPFVDNEGVDRRGLRIREMALPLEMRMSGARQNLRDAYLGRFVLSDALRRPRGSGSGALWNLTQRENGRAQLNQVIAELEAKVGPEESEKCKDAARQLFSWIMNERRSGRKG